MRHWGAREEGDVAPRPCCLAVLQHREDFKRVIAHCISFGRAALYLGRIVPRWPPCSAWHSA